ncbi:hypothetical protein [Mesorhizobium sp. LCM 4576]|uniref:hypothetical protein n=1 Tax=Mesorhizobium sp. LCM 4576 TaxID=1848289 RepID=UPI001042077A|nr:hypothetical protein [Mesorhizobium sp. LCM 4576]
MRFRTVSALAAIVLIVAGCQTAPTGPMPSNNFTFNAGRQTTKEAIVSAYLGRGFQIVRDSDLQLVMDRPAKDNFGAQLVFGSQWNVVPNSRLSLTFLGDNPTQVNAQLAIVTNPGSGFEQVTDLTNNASARQQLQVGMSQAKTIAEAQRSAPKAAKPKPAS